MSAEFEHLYSEEILNAYADGAGVTIEDFRAYMPSHSYIFMPCRDIWPAASVNSRIGSMPVLDKNGRPKRKRGKAVTMSASTWLDQNRPVEQMTWCPGLPMLIDGRLIVDGGWIERPSVTCFNLYRPPRIRLGDARQATRWLDHVRKVFGCEDGEHIINWLAQRVQFPETKINHALVLGGAQGIGKDTLLEPVKLAVGPWNFHEVSPQHMLGRFNGFLKSVILRVNEARDLGEVDRFKFYDHMKAYTAAPPDVLRVDEKHLREYSIFNCCGVVITSNYKTDGMYLPTDDRRHYVAWSDVQKQDFSGDYFNELYCWYAEGGIGHVAAYLHEFDLSDFDPKAPPPKTAAFWDIADASQSPEDAELADVLDRIGNPDAVTIGDIAAHASGDFLDWITDRKNRRAIPYRFEKCGYVPMRNETDQSGRWKINGVRHVIYGRKTLSTRERMAAAIRRARA
jgi:hypothetical protein